MHTYSDKWFKKNYVEFGLYKHTTDVKDVFDYEIPCIHECKYWSFHDLQELYWQAQYRFAKEFKELDAERWYIVRVRRTDFDNIEILKIKDVSKEKDSKLRTH